MSRFLSIATMAVILFMTARISAQQAQPGLPLGRLDTILPCGAKTGTTVIVQLAGNELDDTHSLLFSHPGITAELIKEELPKVDPKDPKKDQPKRRRDMQSQLGSRFKVTVAPDVPLGQYDVRVLHKWGVSNPRTFCVGDLNEVEEKEPNNDDTEAQRVELNTTINGTILTPTDVDFFVFAGKKGQRIILSCLTSSIDSKARPMVEMFDVAGQRLAFNKNYNGYDALADAILAEDGDYVVRVSEFTYTQGSPQHFYRLSISTAPWIDAVFPPMIEPGKPAQVTLYGRNLPGGAIEPGAFADGRPLEKLAVTINPPAGPVAAQSLSFRGRIDPRSAGIDGFDYRIKGPSGTSNPMLISFATAKVVLEKENNDKPETAEEIPVPCEVAGRIDKRQDRDWYAFNAKKGDVTMIDLMSDRLGVPADLYFTLRKDKSANDITEEDDNPEILNLQQFYTRTYDPKPYRFTAPNDGRYLIGVGSRESNFSYGPRITYRLRVTPEKPDFRLVVMPSTNYQPDAAVLHPDGNDYLDVLVFRNDGFNGPITLTADGLPKGVMCPPAIIGAGMKQGVLVLSTAADAAPFNGTFTVKGTATINGQSVVREARSATITWGVQAQQNIPTVARLDRGLYLAVRDKARFKVTLDLDKAFIKKDEKLVQPILLKQNDKLTVPFTITRLPETKTPITLQQIALGMNPQQLPVSVNNGQALAAIAADKKDGTFVIEVKQNTAPGTYAVALKATTPIEFAKEDKKKQNLTVVSATTSVIVKVLPSLVAKVTASPKANLKPGTIGEVVVKVERQADYAGEFKVRIVLPASTKGIAADEATIPADKNEVVVPIKVGADAAPGSLQNIVVQATALLEGRVPVTAEAKFNVVVDKARPSIVAKVTAAPKANLKPGTNGEVIVKVERQADYAGEFKVKFVLPANTKGITVAEATIPAGKNEVIVPVKVGSDAAPGNVQDIVVQATALLEGKVALTAEAKFNLVVDKVAKALPTIVAKVIAAPKANLKPGTNGEVVVKVERQADYAGEFKVKFVLPANTKGITVAEATIPAGKNEVIVPIKVGADAAPGNLKDIVVQATALLEGKVPLTAEAKINLVVDKVAKDKK